RGMDRDWANPGFKQHDRHPVVCVNWNDATAYAAWLSSLTGKNYRLLSEAEREYVTRAGSMTPFWWGKTISTDHANYNGNVTYAGGAEGEWRKATLPVDSFLANPWGLYNVHGNVWEWTGDCWNDVNADNPGDGTARFTGDCSLRVLRGASFNNYPHTLRSARREREPLVSRIDAIGFRVARPL
ncbi:MAG: formylglycine-generating enzyme family protein, partial [Bradyrhizobium sp.]